MSNNLPLNKKDIFCGKLSCANTNAVCTVVGVERHSIARERLADLGFTEGAKVRLLRIAPLGDPLEVEIRGYRLCLRHETAEDILVREDCSVEQSNSANRTFTR